MHPQDLLLAVLGATDRQRVEGRTRFMKLVFLLDQETDVDVDYEFDGYKHGPFTREVLDDLEELDRKGLIDAQKTSTSSGNVMYNFKVTSQGEREVDRIRNRRDEDIVSEIERIVNEYGNKPIFVLLDYVYDEYPDFAEKSAA